MLYGKSLGGHASYLLISLQGSKSYQYKGVLDKLASRAYSYTNASTSTDCTEYELSSAGWDGFAQIVRALSRLYGLIKLKRISSFLYI